MSDLNMMEISRLLDAGVSGGMSDDDMHRVIEYEALVDQVATDILRTKSDNYVAYLVTLIEAISLQDMVNDGTDIDFVLALSKNPVFSIIMARVIKNTIGICILEELR